jgi:putative ABC transport system substrate-binding protein
MRRREFIAAIGGAAAWPVAGRAQARPIIGVLTSIIFTPEQIEAIEAGLREGGYVKDRNLTVVYLSADGQFERLPALVADLIRREVSVILAVGSPVPARQAMAATKTIPIVFAYGGDPVLDGLVLKMNQPEGNVTGATFNAVTLTGKRLELLREIAGDVSLVGLVGNPNSTLAEIEIREAIAAAKSLGQRIHSVMANTEKQIEIAFDAMMTEKVGAVLVGVSPDFYRYRAEFASLADRHKLPAVYFIRDFVVAGGLVSYGARFTDTWRQAAVYVARILHGAKPSELPIMQPTQFELVINAKTAKALGLTIPPALLARADEVIE